MRAYSGNGDTAPLNLSIDISGRHTPKKELAVPSEHKFRWVPRPVGNFAPFGFGTPHNLIRSVVTIPTAQTYISDTSKKKKTNLRTKSKVTSGWNILYMENKCKKK